MLANTLVPVVSTAHLVVRRLIGITRQAHTLGTARMYPESEGSSMTRSTRVALRGSHGVSTIPLTITSPEHRTILFACFNRDHQKPSRRWQPPRVTSITSLQLDYLVPLDAISQCNALESLTRNGFALLASTSELEAYQTKHTQGQHISKVLKQPNAQDPPLFIARKPNRAFGAKLHFLRGHCTWRCGYRTWGGGAPNGRISMAISTSHCRPGTGQVGAVHRPGVAVPPMVLVHVFLPL